jgi:hypothetical protein
MLPSLPILMPAQDASSLEYPEPTHSITRTYLDTGINMPAEEMNLLQAMKGSARVLVRGGSEASAGAELDMDQRMKSPSASADNKPDDTRQTDEADLDGRQEGSTDLVTADTADGTDGNRRESLTSSIIEPSDGSSPQAFLPARRREGVSSLKFLPCVASHSYVPRKTQNVCI